MTLPKKPSRPIEVNGRHYRWMVKPEKHLEGWVRVTIEDQETKKVYQTRRRGFMDANARVTPGDVKEIILNHFQGETCPSTT